MAEADGRLGLTLPGGIADERSRRLLALVEDRLGALDVAAGVYRIEDVTASALPALAWQFNLVDEGWDLARGEAARRALLLAGLEIHRLKGTPAALKRALGAIGVTAELTEWWQRVPAGPVHTFGLMVWVNDQLAADGLELSAEVYRRLARVVDGVKPVRSHYDLRVGARFEQGLAAAGAARSAGVARRSADAAAVQPVPAGSALAAAGAGRSVAVLRISMTV